MNLRVIGFTIASLALVGWIVAVTNADVLAATNSGLALQQSRVTIGKRTVQCPMPKERITIPAGCPQDPFGYFWADESEDGGTVPEVTRDMVDLRLGDAAALLSSMGLVGLGLLLFGGRPRPRE